MADLIEVSHSHYSKCESGHNSFSAKFLERFSERTGVSLSWLTTGKGDMHAGPPAAKGGVGAPPSANPVRPSLQTS
jgi:transcriptional regulator with XRE-family HTH domain